MAKIDLRNATLDILDGTTVSGTIANGYPVGTTTMTIDGITMAIPNGSIMTVVGQGTVYTVSSTTGGTTPTAVTFTPALTVAVADNAVIRFAILGLLVNDATANAGDSTISVDGLSQAIQNGTTFTIAGDVTVYTISSSVGGATPTSITFTPVLAFTAADDAVITLVRSGAVNNPAASVVNGATSFGVAGFSVALTEGMIFTIVGSTDSYEVVSSIGGSTPTSVTFVPALRTAAGIPVAGAAITVHTNVLRVTLGEGNFTFEPKRTFEYTRDRRAIAFVTSGDDEPMDVSFDFLWIELAATDGDPPTIFEALTKTGEAADWLTAGADPCEPYCVTLRLTNDPPCTDEEREIITFPEYRWESLPHDLKAGTVSSKGKCKDLLPTIQKSA